MRVTVIGAGAVGTVLAAHLVRAGHAVKLVIRDEDVPAMQSVRHLRVDRVTGGPPLTVDKPALATGVDLDAADAAFICVKHPDLRGVLDAFGDAVPAHCAVLPCQNGVGATQRIRQRFPAIEPVAATVMFNAQTLQPLHARVTTEPTLLMRTADARLLSLFRDTGLRVRRVRGEGAAWGKLLINLANAICALTHATFHDVLHNADLRTCFLAALDEAVDVLDATDAPYRLPASLPYAAYRRMLQLTPSLALRASAFHRTASPHAYPSMVADMLSARPTEVTQLNGEICRLGELCGRPTPINARITRMIQEREERLPAQFLSPSELRQALALED
ncbi:2-dehydropantoate 2-reductase [uncultured Abyssibacter sp.]|uniref:ketopantoate reductase family protein n=1 Tax=uncultured Abyssibacter sp. TaxID=2320202 RepID=UPI0032B2F3D9